MELKPRGKRAPSFPLGLKQIHRCIQFGQQRLGQDTSPTPLCPWAAGGARACRQVPQADRGRAASVAQDTVTRVSSLQVCKGWLRGRRSGCLLDPRAQRQDRLSTNKEQSGYQSCPGMSELPIPGRVHAEAKSQRGCRYTFKMCSLYDSV